MLNDIKEWETCESSRAPSASTKPARRQRGAAEARPSRYLAPRSSTVAGSPQKQDSLGSALWYSFTEHTNPRFFYRLAPAANESQMAVAGTGLTPVLKPTPSKHAPARTQLRPQLTAPRAAGKLKQLFIGKKPRLNEVRCSSFHHRRRASARLSLDSRPQGVRLLSCMRLDPRHSIN